MYLSYLMDRLLISKCPFWCLQISQIPGHFEINWPLYYQGRSTFFDYRYSSFHRPWLISKKVTPALGSKSAKQIMPNYILHTYFLPKLSFSLDQPVTKNQILNSSVYFYGFFCNPKEKRQPGLGEMVHKEWIFICRFCSCRNLFCSLNT